MLHTASAASRVHPPSKHGEPSEQLLFRRAQQVVAPVDRMSQASAAGPGKSRAPPVKNLETAFQAAPASRRAQAS